MGNAAGGGAWPLDFSSSPTARACHNVPPGDVHYVIVDILVCSPEAWGVCVCVGVYMCARARMWTRKQFWMLADQPNDSQKMKQTSLPASKAI